MTRPDRVLGPWSLAPALPARASAVDRMAAIGRLGLTISVCCGPSGASLFRWSVQILSVDGQEFERPFTATSFDHAIAIAECELARRGW